VITVTYSVCVSGEDWRNQGKAVRNIGCPRCGSTKVKVISAEFAFTQDRERFIYSVLSPAVCLDCGIATACLPPDTHDELKRLFHVRATRGEHLPQAMCPNCNSNSLAVFEPVEVAFGLGKGPPVHLTGQASLKACLRCTFSEFCVQGGDLTKIQLAIGTELRPPISGTPRLAKRTA